MGKQPLYILVLHCGPAKPAGHVHLYELVSDRQLPPFQHGFW